mmetsp:Transcript_39737/g.45622  ORF Transcript_39737/g.45622 Transcript_39737/m.45622 type:complete len:96 (+) Transcript_39737:296-583(+)
MYLPQYERCTSACRLQGDVRPWIKNLKSECVRNVSKDGRLFSPQARYYKSKRKKSSNKIAIDKLLTRFRLKSSQSRKSIVSQPVSPTERKAIRCI